MHNLTDRSSVQDILNIKEAGVKKTRIIMKDHDTGEILGEFENKILVPGSQATACKQFGIEPVVNLPTYNTELKLENSLPAFPATQPTNTPITCLWCAGRSGAGNSPSEVFVVSNTDRISPNMVGNAADIYGIETYTDIIPFRYVSEDMDLDEDLRRIYFGRKEVGKDDKKRIAYFFKAFDTDPQLHIRYLDGTEVTEEMYSVDSSQLVEVYVEMRLAVTRKDFRDYFDEVLGWDNADISTISLLTAWYIDNIPENPDADEEDQVKYRCYQDIIPFSKFNFGKEQLVDLNRAIDFNYQVYY